MGLLRACDKRGPFQGLSKLLKDDFFQLEVLVFDYQSLRVYLYFKEYLDRTSLIFSVIISWLLGTYKVLSKNVLPRPTRVLNYFCIFFF